MKKTTQGLWCGLLAIAKPIIVKNVEIRSKGEEQHQQSQKRKDGLWTMATTRARIASTCSTAGEPLLWLVSL